MEVVQGESDPTTLPPMDLDVKDGSINASEQRDVETQIAETSIVTKVEEVDETKSPIVNEENIDTKISTEEVDNLESNDTFDPVQLHLVRLIKSNRNDAKRRQKDLTIFNFTIGESQWRQVLSNNIKTSAKASAFERAPSYRGDTSVIEKGSDGTKDLQKTERMQERLMLRLQKHRKGMSIKVKHLRDTYRKLHKGWRIHCDRLDKIKESRQDGGEPANFREETSIKELEDDTVVTFKETTTTVAGSPSKPSMSRTTTILTESGADSITTTDVPVESNTTDQMNMSTDETPIQTMANGDETVSTSTASVSTPAKNGILVAMTSPQTASNSNHITVSSSVSMTRSNRRNTQGGGGGGLVGFGDAVRSEAEFLEILASLETADMQDPNMRAARTTAVEPDMCLDRWSCTASTRILKEESTEKEGEEDLYLGERDEGLARSMYDDDNGFVADPKTFYETDFDPDFWSEEEMTIFARRYVLFPKQFGKIAASLPHKTAAQCVAYYYLTKKEEGHDYKALLASRSRGQRRKTRLVKPKKGRGSALMADLKAATPVVGNDSALLNDDDEASPSTPLSPNASAVLGGRRSGAASGRGRNAQRGRLQQQQAEMSTDSTDGLSKVTDVPTTTAKRGRGAKSNVVSTRTKVVETLSVPVEDVEMQSPASGKLTPTGTKPISEEALGQNGKARGRQPTSSYWSVAERNQFLRSLAIVGKDWDYVAQNLTTKSAAQARNYFARNEKEVDFIEAINLAEQQAGKSLEEREEAADKLIQRRTALTSSFPSALAPANIKTSPQMPSTSLVPPIVEHAPSDYDEEDSQSRNSSRNGLNISSLLNADGDATAAKAARRSSLQDWFGGSQEPPSASYGHQAPNDIRASSPYEHERMPTREEMYSGQNESSIRRSWQDVRGNDAYRHADSRQPTSVNSSARYSSIRSPSMYSGSQTQYESARDYDIKEEDRNISSMHRQPFSHYRKVESERTTPAYENVPRPQQQLHPNDDHRSSMMPPPPSSIMSDQRSSGRPYYAPSRPASSYGYSEYESRGQLGPPQSVGGRHHSAEVSVPSEYNRYGGHDVYREDQRMPPSRSHPIHTQSPTPPPSSHASSLDPHRSPVLSSRIGRNDPYPTSYGRQSIPSSNAGRHYYDQAPMSQSNSNFSHYRSQGPVSSSRHSNESNYLDSRSPQEYDHQTHRSSRDRRTPPPTLPSPHSPFFGRRYDDQQRHR